MEVAIVALALVVALKPELLGLASSRLTGTSGPSGGGSRSTMPTQPAYQPTAPPPPPDTTGQVVDLVGKLGSGLLSLLGTGGTPTGQPAPVKDGSIYTQPKLTGSGTPSGWTEPDWEEGDDGGDDLWDGGI